VRGDFTHVPAKLTRFGVEHMHHAATCNRQRAASRTPAALRVRSVGLASREHFGDGDTEHLGDSLGCERR
jgi:hypothetical protein